jgi:serine phosphatase RsbU (regulator of sigma subunit)
MTVSLLVGAVRTLADHTSNPLTILSSLNQRLPGRSNGDFSTCLVLHVSATGLVTLANAGHLPPHLNGIAIPIYGSLPLGLIPGAEFPVCFLRLNEGGELTLSTDGVLEAQRETTGELFGFDRTNALPGTRPSIQTIAETARTFGQADDITVVQITRTRLTSQTHISMNLLTLRV